MTTEWLSKLYGFKECHIVNQFTAGNSNESYLLEADGAKYVLRLNSGEEAAIERALAIQDAVHERSGLAAKPRKSASGRYTERLNGGWVKRYLRDRAASIRNDEPFWKSLEV